MLNEMRINDEQLETSDIRQLESADEIAHFFARLRYDVDERTNIPDYTALGMGSEDMRQHIHKIELIGKDPEDGDISIYLFEVRSVTAKLRNDIARRFRERPENAILVLTKDYEELEFVSNLINYYHKRNFLDVTKIRFQKILIQDAKLLPIFRISPQVSNQQRKIFSDEMNYPAACCGVVHADANLNQIILLAARRREPALDFQTAMEAGLSGVNDPEVLARAAREGRLLVTHDRKTMPRHFLTFITTATSAGVLIVPQHLPVTAVVDDLL